MDFIEQVKIRAAQKKCVIVLPESYDERVAQAAGKITEEGIARIVLLSDGVREILGEEGLRQQGVEILDGWFRGVGR